MVLNHWTCSKVWTSLISMLTSYLW